MTNRMNSLKKAEKFVWNEDMEKDFLEFSVVGDTSLPRS